MREANTARSSPWFTASVDSQPLQNGAYEFKNLSNVVHVDEKWLHVTRSTRTVREHPDEARHEDDTTQHKSHIEKVMFLTAVGVPQV